MISRPRICFAAMLLMAAAAGASAQKAEPRRPNLLLIMAEDLSPRLGAYGDSVARTPNVDKLAQDSVRYTRAFTTSGVCAASRAAIIMGAHQNSWGAGHMRAAAGGYVAVPPPEWKAFPELLRAGGYAVVNNGKTDYQMSTTLGGAFGGPPSIWDVASGDDWRDLPRDRPFFAYLTLAGTHESQVWPTWSLQLGWELALAPGRIANHLGWEHETDPGDVVVPTYYPDTPTVRADIARHYNNIASMDRQVGEILARLEADGLADDTIVIFTTDHGDGLPRAKRWVYDSGIHVPLIVRWPDGSGAGTVAEELVSLVDLPPTLLALAGLPRPEHHQGRVFLGAQREPEPAYVYAARDRMDEQSDTVRSLRDRRFKYIRNLNPELPYVLPIGFRNRMPMMQEMLALAEEGKLEGVPALWFRARRDVEELYDTQLDPEETNNLARSPEHAAQRERLSAALDNWLASTVDLGLLPEEQLKERFWPGGKQPKTATPTLQIDERGRVSMASPTEGASIGYREDGGSWQLYTQPLQVPGVETIAARAVRYGWEESDEVVLRVR